MKFNTHRYVDYARARASELAFHITYDVNGVAIKITRFIVPLIIEPSAAIEQVLLRSAAVSSVAPKSYEVVVSSPRGFYRRGVLLASVNYARFCIYTENRRRSGPGN